MVLCNFTDTFEIPNGSDVTDIKIMLWENLGNLVPLVPSLAKKVE